MAVLGRKATPHVFYLWHREVSQSLEGQPAGFQKSSTCFLGSEQGTLAQVPTACMWAAASGQECSSPPTTTCAPAPKHSNAPHSARFCAQLCMRQPLCTAGKQCFVHGGAHLQCVHGARSRPAVGSRLAEGSGVHRLSAVGSGLNLRGESGNEGWRRL